MCQSSLLRYVPGKARYRRQRLEDRRNAWFAWREAARVVVPIGEDDRVLWDVLWGDEKTEEPVDFPTGEGRRRVHEWLGANGRARELTDEGLRRGKFQFLESRGPGHFGEDPGAIIGFRDLSRVRFIRAEALAADGDLQAAAEELAAGLRMGAMICAGDGYVSSHMFGDLIQGEATKGISRLAERHPLPREALETLVAAVDEGLDGHRGLAQSVRVDLCCGDLPELDALPGSDDLPATATKVLWTTPEAKAHWRKVLGPEGLPDGIMERQCEGFVDVLRGHPCPLDRRDTARLMGRIVADTVAYLESGGRSRRIGIRSLVARTRQRCRYRRRRRLSSLWPVEFTRHFVYAFFGNHEDVCKSLGDDEEHVRKWIEALMRAHDRAKERGWELLTRDERSQLRAQLRGIHNPVGLLLLDGVSHGSVADLAVKTQQKRQDLKADLGRRLRKKS